MPIEYAISLERDLLYARWYGEVDFDQFQASFGHYLNDTNYRPGRPELIDHSQVTAMDINFGLVKSILRQVNAQAPGQIVTTKTVIYSPNDTVYGLGRMYQILSDMADGIQVEVFRTERKALAALSLEHDSIAALLSAETFLPPTPKAD